MRTDWKVNCNHDGGGRGLIGVLSLRWDQVMFNWNDPQFFTSRACTCDLTCKINVVLLDIQLDNAVRVCLEFTAACKVPFDMMSDASEAMSGSSGASEYPSLCLIH